MAVWLAWDSAAFRGEEGVAKGWLQRARRLLDGQPDSPEHAFLAARASVFALLDDGDPEAADALPSKRSASDKRSARSTTRWSDARCTGSR